MNQAWHSPLFARTCTFLARMPQNALSATTRRKRMSARRSCLAALAGLVAIASSTHCQATSWCFVQKLVESPQGLELRFDTDRNMFVRITADNGQVAPNDPTFQVSNGDAYRSLDGGTRLAERPSRVQIGKGQEAFVSGDFHSGCIVRPASHEGHRGAWMESTVSFPGFAPETTKRFVPVSR